MIDIRPATPADVEYVALNLREADDREIRTSSQMLPLTAMNLSAELSDETYAVFPVFGDQEDTKPVAIFGVSADPHAEGRGVVWLMSTKMLRGTSRDILKEAPVWLDRWSQRYPRALHNVIDSRNLQHLAWCKRMGFKFVGIVPVHGIPFIHAIRSCVTPSQSPQQP